MMKTIMKNELVEKIMCVLQYLKFVHTINFVRLDKTGYIYICIYDQNVLIVAILIGD